MNLRPYLTVPSFPRCVYLMLSFSAAEQQLTGLPPFSLALLFTSWANCQTLGLFIRQDGFCRINIRFKIELKGIQLSAKLQDFNSTSIPLVFHWGKPNLSKILLLDAKQSLWAMCVQCWGRGKPRLDSLSCLTQSRSLNGTPTCQAI